MNLPSELRLKLCVSDACTHLVHDGSSGGLSSVRNGDLLETVRTRVTSSELLLHKRISILPAYLNS